MVDDDSTLQRLAADRECVKVAAWIDHPDVSRMVMVQFDSSDRDARDQSWAWESGTKAETVLAW